mmetsp:Transcript_19934/g.64196  ORF Transcript_19934/g.64196 Transcript_19934/m.64196 type:complete len:227 (-) Transcript_19934:153-833(-)
MGLEVGDDALADDGGVVLVLPELVGDAAELAGAVCFDVESLFAKVREAPLEELASRGRRALGGDLEELAPSREDPAELRPDEGGAAGRRHRQGQLGIGERTAPRTEAVPLVEAVERLAGHAERRVQVEGGPRAQLRRRLLVVLDGLPERRRRVARRLPSEERHDLRQRRVVQLTKRQRPLLPGVRQPHPPHRRLLLPRLLVGHALREGRVQLPQRLLLLRLLRLLG